MSDRCIYCDPNFGEDLKDDVSSQELGGDEIDIGAFGELGHVVYMTSNGIEMFLFDNKGDVISKVTAPVNYCPMCGRKIDGKNDEDRSIEKNY